jgi:hypothetical protein
MRSRKKEKLVFQLFFPDFAVQKDSKIKGLNYSVKKKKKLFQHIHQINQKHSNKLFKYFFFHLHNFSY